LQLYPLSPRRQRLLHTLHVPDRSATRVTSLHLRAQFLIAERARMARRMTPFSKIYRDWKRKEAQNRRLQDSVHKVWSCGSLDTGPTCRIADEVNDAANICRSFGVEHETKSTAAATFGSTSEERCTQQPQQKRKSRSAAVGTSIEWPFRKRDIAKFGHRSSTIFQNGLRKPVQRYCESARYSHFCPLVRFGDLIQHHGIVSHLSHRLREHFSIQDLDIGHRHWSRDLVARARHGGENGLAVAGHRLRKCSFSSPAMLQHVSGLYRSHLHSISDQ
jgi:hypothetical protein